ncbi:MAG: alpha-glucan family phosphorylase [Chloroflexota bacterium]
MTNNEMASTGGTHGDIAVGAATVYGDHNGTETLKHAENGGPDHRGPQARQIAYFSMEAGLESAMPTYSGGLGVLAGDTLRAAADLSLPMVGVTLLYHRGFFRQVLDARGNQVEEACQWVPSDFLELLPERACVEIEGRRVWIAAWRKRVRGHAGDTVPVYFLDTRLEENEPPDRALTDALYAGDQRHRLRQEVLLGLGGVAMLRALGFTAINKYHMNEGHAALLTLALLDEQIAARGGKTPGTSDVEAVRAQCVFTTHTPVPAGHDSFHAELVRDVLGDERLSTLEAVDALENGGLNMTHLGLMFSNYVNGVSMRHGEVSRGMFPSHPIKAVTNGIHAGTWASRHFSRLFDERVPDWRSDNHYLRYSAAIPLEEIRGAHAKAKSDLLRAIEDRTGELLDPDVLTLGFARRATAYKRADLLFSDTERLRRIAREAGPVQVIYAGKAHPHDGMGKDVIRRVFEARRELGDAVKIVYLENYDMDLARLLCSGVDVWLNNPQRPLEASGTSGMKAALNGVPSLSVLDGWWVEGHLEGVTGWAFGCDCKCEARESRDAEALYDKLENVVIPQFYNDPEAFAWIMRSAIAINASFFNTQRMVAQYWEHAYDNSAMVGADA